MTPAATRNALDFAFEEGIKKGIAQERERCAKIADKFVERTNSDLAHAIAAAIREGR